MGGYIILLFVVLFAVNWLTLQKSETTNKLYEKLEIESIFVKKYQPAYQDVSKHISEHDYLDKAKLFHKEFRYDVVKFMDGRFNVDKLKTLKKAAKVTNPVPYDSLPKELQDNVNETADKFVSVLLESCKPKTVDPQRPRRRRRR